MKILITESQYFKLLKEETESDKNCKIWVDSENDPKYKRYLIEYKVYMDAYKLAKRFWPQIKNLQDYEWYVNSLGHDKFDRFKWSDVENRKWLYDKNDITVQPGYLQGMGINNDKVKKFVLDNIKKYKIEPISTGWSDVKLPIYEKPKKVCVKPKVEPKPITIPQKPKDVVQPQPLRPNPITKFSVSWREDTPSGEVNQNTHYFSDYNEWKEFVTQYPHFSSKNENGSKTEAQALYSGLHADISKDKTVKGPR